MARTRTIVVGAGQAGLALSWHLTQHGHEHVLLERGRIAERWQSQRWDSLHTLTPNWMTRLPGRSYDGPDPDGFVPAAQLATFLRDYAASFRAPVEENTAVEAVSTDGDGRFVVVTDRGTWTADNAVLATGWCDVARIPVGASELPGTVAQLGADRYRNVAQLPDGAVLVVGASASGVQIADELARAGREVTIAVGSHTRAPRSYRGVDICRWLEDLGELDRALSSATDPRAKEPSLQLVGGASGRSVDLATLAGAGVRLAGRVEGIEDGRVHFGTGLAERVARSEERLARLLARIDAHIAATGAASHLPPPQPLPPVVTGPSPSILDARHDRLGAVVWATGYRRSYPWLHVPVLDSAGEILHHRGVTPIPGMYVVGMRFQTRRRSTFIDGVRFDAAEIAGHLLRTDAGNHHDVSPTTSPTTLAAAAA